MTTISYWDGTAYVELTNNTLQGIPITEIVDDTLDIGTIVVNNDIEDYLDLWDSIKIVSGTKSKCFLIADIDTQMRKTQYPYQHTISLIEATKYLEKVYCSSMSLTNKNDTLLDQFNKALINAEPIRLTETPRFTASASLVARLQNEPMRDFFIEKATLREVLDGILGAIDLRVEVYEITDFNNIILDYYDLNAKNRLIVLDELVDRQTVENIEFLGSDIEAYGENAFTGSRSPIYHPSPNGWDTFKTNEAILTRDNAVMSTAFPIEEIKKFFIKTKCKLEVFNGSSVKDTPELTLDLDISSNVVDQETHDILSNSGITPPLDNNLYLTSILYKDNTIYYTRAEDTISFSTLSGLFLTETTLNYAIRNAIYKQDVVTQWYNSNQDPTYDGYNTLSDINLVGFSITNTLFRAKYIPYIDAHTKLSKKNYSKVPSTIIDNQADKTIDLERYGDNLQSTINRLGNKTLVVDKVHKNIDEVFEVQDYTADGYVLTKKTIGLYNNFIKAHYEFTKDFNSVNERIGIDRRKRIYNIPLENIVRDVLIKEYMIASFDGSIVNTPITNLFMDVFSPAAEKLAITNALVQTGWFNDNGYTVENSDWFELSVAPYSMANSLHFRFKFIDNYSAGMSTANQVLGGKKQVPNPYVKTSGSLNIGEHNRIRIILLNDKLAVRGETYDEIKLLPKTTFSWYDSTQKIFDKSYHIEKDAYEYMTYVYQLEILSADPNIIISNNIAKLHPMTSNIAYSLKVYTSDTETYKQGDLKAKGTINNSITYYHNGVENRLQLIENVEPYDPIVLPATTKSWCVADNFGNILVAVNKVGETNISNNVRFNHKTIRN